MSDQLKGLLITTLGVLFIVPDSLFIRLIDAPALTIIFWRGIGSSTAITLWLLLTYGTQPFKDLRKAGASALVYSICLGLAGILFVLAITLTDVANVVFIIASIPIFAAILSRIFLGETISPRVRMTIIAVLAGVFLIAGGSLSAGPEDLLGIGVALLVSIIFAGGVVSIRVARPVSLVAAAPIGALGASLLVLPFTDPLSADPAQWHLYAMHGGLFIAASTVLITIGARYISAPEVSLLILLESILAPILVWAFIGETISTTTFIGGAIVLTALFVSNFVALRRRAPA
ncbi:MAG: DMT family transporter [Pseudomonadota bacterium]